MKALEIPTKTFVAIIVGSFVGLFCFLSWVNQFYSFDSNPSNQADYDYSLAAIPSTVYSDAMSCIELGNYGKSLSENRLGLKCDAQFHNDKGLSLFSHQMYHTHKMMGNPDSSLYYLELYLNQLTPKAHKVWPYSNPGNVSIATSNWYRTQPPYWQRLIICGMFLICTLLLGISLSKVWSKPKEKKLFTRAIISARELERRRIARELHDGLGQSLLLIKKQVESNLYSNLENSEKIAEALDEVRVISRNLHPVLLEKLGLRVSLKKLLSRIQKSSGIYISEDIVKDGLELTPFQEKQLYRVIQEAFSNIVKHSKATAAKLMIQRRKNCIHIAVKDNGTGFDHELKIARTNSLGLKSMYERILSIGGELKFISNGGNGCHLSIAIPLAR